MQESNILKKKIRNFPIAPDVQSYLGKIISRDTHPCQGLPEAALNIYVDMTHCCNYDAEPVGIIRVSLEYGAWLARERKGTPIAWQRGSRKFIKLPEWTIKEARYKEYLASHTPRPEDEVLAKPAVVLAPAHYWASDANYRHDLCELGRQSGVILAPFVHDTIWARFPHYFPVGTSRCMQQVMDEVMAASGVIITDSNCSLRDVQEYSRKKGLPEVPILTCRYADELRFEPVATDQKFLKLAQGPGFVLFVSAFYHHKNHQLLLAVWERLLEEYDPRNVPVLVCVGASGLSDKRFLNDAFRNPAVRKHVKLFRKVDDNTLHWLYDNCLFTVFPSLYEGWGLPVGESLAHGKICVASNAASIPEIAPEYTDLLDPRDFSAWHGTICEYAFNSEARKKRELELRDYRPTSWGESIEALIRKLNSRFACSKKKPLLEPGKVYSRSFFSYGPFIKDGWDIAGDDITLRCGETGSLEFIFPQDGKDYQLNISGVANGASGILKVFAGPRLWQETPLAVNEVTRYLIPVFSDLVDPVQGTFSLQLYLDTTAPYEKNGVRNFRLESIAIEPCCLTRPENEVIKELENLCPAVAAPMRHILLTRPDIRIFPKKPGGALRLLLWIWAYGIGEEITLGNKLGAIRQALINLVSTSSEKAKVEGYSRLIDGICEGRPDLQNMLPHTAQGQQALVNWFQMFGMKEYFLEQLIPSGDGNWQAPAAQGRNPAEG